jgi:hypothetical protein
MARRARKHRAEAKPQQAERHSQPLDPKRLQGQNIGPSSVQDPRTATDVKVCADRSEKKVSQGSRESLAKKRESADAELPEEDIDKTLADSFSAVTHLRGQRAGTKRRIGRRSRKTPNNARGHITGT